MEEDFKRRKDEIKNNQKNILFILLISLIWQFSIGFVGVDSSMLMIETMLKMFGVLEWQRELLLTFSSLMMIYTPTIVTILCNVKNYKLNKENERLKIEETNYLSNKYFEENKNQIDELLKQGRKLSRKELMNLLNMTKAELLKIEKRNNVKCKMPDELMLNYLQNGIEDILFSPGEDETKDYTRTRKK